MAPILANETKHDTIILGFGGYGGNEAFSTLRIG
jgi:hypothetical protein